MRNRFVFLLVFGLAAVFQTGAAHAMVAFTEPVHRTFVFLHVVGAVVFLGNMIVTAMWMTQAKRSANSEILHFASRTVMRGDWLFTLPGVGLLLVPGLLTVGPWGGIPGASWAEVALTLLILSGVIWVVVLAPMQRKMIRLSADAVAAKAGVGDQFYTVLGRWMIWGGIATVLPMISVYLMVYKPSLWR